MLLSAVLAVLQLGAAPQSEDQLREARSAQTRFESVRRANLPLDRSSGTRQECDAQIGRYCYWYDSTDSEGPPESRTISQARAELLALLSSVSERHPEDLWLVGQRVRYLLEDGKRSEALLVAQRCRAEGWWCSALEGLVLHASEQYSEADAAFGAALNAMPEDRKCDWLDLRSLFERALEREFARANCAERERIANQLWTLSQPLWSIAGNDLRTEHFARRTMAAARQNSANPLGFHWASDDVELLVRYGWDKWYTRRLPEIHGFAASPLVTGHSRAPSYDFFPTAEAFALKRVRDSEWNLRDPLARTRYAPAHVKRLTGLPHQLSRFPRGDSMLVAVAWRAEDSVLARDSTVAWLVTIRSPDDRAPHIRGTKAGTSGHGTLLAMMERDSMVASIEVRGDSSRHAGRARYSIDPVSCDGPWCLSDLMLFDGTRPPSEVEVASVLEVATSDLRFPNRQPIGVFWEVHGVPAERVPVWLSLTVTPVSVGRLRRLATTLRLAADLAPVRLRWQATLREGAREGQHLTVRLPSTARGRYRVLLTVEPPGAPPVSAAREIEVIP